MVATLRLPVSVISFIIYSTIAGALEGCQEGFWRLGPKEAECFLCGKCVDSTLLTPVKCNAQGGSCSPNRCAPGYYGDRCLQECGRCLGGSRNCHSTEGRCRLGCQQGYGGELCNQQCLQGTFGEDCNETCGKCLGGNERCDPEVGSCAEGCMTGWAGLYCRIPCPDGRFGVNCNERCGNCKHLHMCDKVTGYCVGGCKDGFHGDTCTDICPRGKFGPNCLMTCTGCKKGCSCDPFTGRCEDVCTGNGLALLAGVAPGNDENDHSTMKVVTPAIVVSVVALVVGLGVVAGVIYYTRRKNMLPAKQVLKAEVADDSYENMSSSVYKRKASPSK